MLPSGRSHPGYTLPPIPFWSPPPRDYCRATFTVTAASGRRLWWRHRNGTKRRETARNRNENRYAHAPQPGSPPRESHPNAYHTVARTARSHGPHAIIRQPAHVTRLAGYRPTTRVLPLGRARLYLEHNSHGSRHITQHRACRIMSASCNPTAHSAPVPWPTSEVVAPADV